MHTVLARASPAVVAHQALAFASVWPWLFGCLAVALLISGIDDFIPLLICACHHIHRIGRRSCAQLRPLERAERRIAIFVPCWKESGVIGNMVRHNLAAIRYRNFDFFLGVYPNDQPTIDAANQLAEVSRNVHVAVCPRAGPTSKADCLNSIYRRMMEFEDRHGAFFDTVVLHDAEDLIHPEALALINRERDFYAMVQVPVLPLPTPLHEATHGIYCDEFAEFQTLDMHARQFSGSFVPSNGVGTGFAREILQRLEKERTEVFDADSLTEDYEIGIYIHDSGYRQLFAPLTRVNNEFVATREYFPRTANSAIRQRTRWITGIALQCWERRGWRGDWRTRYWFWRDRKGLLANPLSLLTNFLFFGGLMDLAASVLQRRPWVFAVNNPHITKLCVLTLGLQCVRIGLRMLCTGRIFGFVFACGVPLRCFHANLINCFATLRAIWRYAHARRGKTVLVWQKTEHQYAGHDTLTQHRREFSEVLSGCGFISEEGLAQARDEMPAGTDLSDYLLSQELVSDDDMCRARSIHTGVPSIEIHAEEVKPLIARSLPAHLEKSVGIVPVNVQAGRLVVAGPRVPSAEHMLALQEFTSLPIEFQLVTQRNYRELQKLLF